MESRGCSIRLKKPTTFAQITVLAQLPQIPYFIASREPFRYYMVNVHRTFGLPALLAATVTL